MRTKETVERQMRTKETLSRRHRKLENKPRTQRRLPTEARKQRAHEKNVRPQRAVEIRLRTLRSVGAHVQSLPEQQLEVPPTVQNEMPPEIIAAELLLYQSNGMPHTMPTPTMPIHVEGFFNSIAMIRWHGCPSAFVTFSPSAVDSSFALRIISGGCEELAVSEYEIRSAAVHSSPG